MGNLAVSMILYRFTTKNRRFRLWYRLSIFLSDGISGETEFGGGRRKDRRVEREKLLWKREKSFRRDLGLS